MVDDDAEIDDIIATYEIWDALNGLSLTSVMADAVTLTVQIAPQADWLAAIRQQAPLTLDPSRRA